ncbi:MAG: DUF2059 domain-containing protein [Pikeienuella sp.]
MIKRISLAIALLAAGPALAQSPETQEAAKRYIEMPGVQQMMDDMFSADTLAQGFLSALPPNVEVTPEQSAEIGELMASSVSSLRPTIQQAMLDGAAKHFTADELNALITFYESEQGASVMAKMQPYMQDVMGQIMPQMMAAQQQSMPEILKILGLQ